MNQKLLVVETNMAWAVPYWVERKRLRKLDGETIILKYVRT